MILECNGITKKYLTKRAVDNLSLTLDEGRIYALLGPNGSGKSTLMKMIDGLITPDAGSIIFKGQPLTYKDKAHIAYMPTEGYFFPYMNSIDAGNYYKDFFPDFDMEKYNKLLGEMDLDPKLKLSKMSSGMLAKMKISITMARNADIIMLDEPLNGIDLIARDKVMSAIVESINENTTVLISTHLVEELESVCDSAIYIKNGRIVGIVNAEEARENSGESLQDIYRKIFA